MVNKLLGKGKRWIAIVVLSAIAVVSIYFAYAARFRRPVAVVESQSLAPRHQIYGDPAVIAEMESSDFASVFPGLGERFLACYVQPGGSKRLDMSRYGGREAIEKGVLASLTNNIVFVGDESFEALEVKRMVNWIKSEMRECLAGGDTVSSYIEQLELRQQEEHQIFMRVMNELLETSDDEVWNARNSTLRALGLRTVPKRKKGAKNAESRK